MKPSRAFREGDDFLICYDDADLALHFTRFRETDAAIRTLVTPITIETRQRALAPMMVNLFTKADREKLTTAICERLDGPTAPLKSDWGEFVECGFATVIDMFTTPEELVNLATIEAAPDGGSLIEPSVLLRGQINILLADQKSGKSYDVMMIGVAVSLGRTDLLPAPLRLVGPGGPVIYYDAETDRSAQRRRLERIAAGLHLPRLPDIHYRRVRPPIADRATAMQAEIARLGAVLVIVDSLTFSAGGNLNDPDVSGPTMNAIGDLGEGVTTLLTAHHAKAARNTNERPSIIGSGLFEMKARNIWLVRRESDVGKSYIDQAWSHEWINDGRQETGFGMRLQFNETNTKVELSSIAASESSFVAQNTGTNKERVYAAVIGTDFMKLSTPGIVQATGIPAPIVARAARELIDEGRFKLLEGGKGRGNAATYAAVQADRKKIVSGPAGNTVSGASDPLQKIVTENSHPKGNSSDYFGTEGCQENSHPENNQKIVTDYFNGGDDDWAGAS